MIFGPWMKYGGHPLALGLLFGAVVGAMTGLMRLFAPGWDGTPLVLLCVLATLAGYYSYHFIQHSLLRVSGAPTFRLVEAAILLLLLQVVTNASEGRANPLTNLPRLDYQTLLASGMLLFVWLEAGQVARDLDQLGEPPDPGPHYVPPSERLAGRFFGGGAILLIATGLSYVGLRELLDLSRLSAVGVLPNVLLYFLLGTAMLAQVHYALQRYRWQEQGLAVAPTVSRRWTSYSLAFLGLAILLAALLPTRYTLGLLDVLRAALGLLILAAQFVLFLILYVFMWLLSLVLPAVQVPSAPVMPAGPLTPPAPLSPDGAGGGSDWLG